MRALKAAVIVMGVLIVAGVAVLVATLIGRVGGAMTPGAAGTAALPALLDEPPGTHIAASALSGDRLVLQLSGGGPDRVVVFDLARARVAGRVALAR